jgi:transposase
VRELTLKRLIGESRRKDDRMDAQALARLARIDPRLLSPIQHRSAQAQADLALIRARAALVRARTVLINTARGLAKSNGERLRGRNSKTVKPAIGDILSPELQAALSPLLSTVEAMTATVREYDRSIVDFGKDRYPEVALLTQVHGVGPLIALTYILTLEDPHRFSKSRDAGCYVGLQPARRNSGQSQPQLHISKEGDSYFACAAHRGRTPHSGAIWSRQRSAPLGTATGFPGCQARKETSGGCGGSQAGCPAASLVDKRRSV